MSPKLLLIGVILLLIIAGGVTALVRHEDRAASVERSMLADPNAVQLHDGKTYR